MEQPNFLQEEKQPLPNATLILVFGIISIVLCCCYGIGIVFSIATLVMAPKALRTYNENPAVYKGYQNVITGRILAIIGLILNIIYIGFMIYIFTTYTMEEIMMMNEEFLQQYQIE
ncbi:MAG: DUF4190 domain-containing protein [Bacteroidetes bacterium]|nr:DUF4190 domain-containing protein [Bacteroidota bacterium]